MTQAALFAFFCVFVRVSALFLSAPIFGAQTTPVTVRVMTTLAFSGAVAASVQPKIGPIPNSLGELMLRVLMEAAVGLLVGTFASFALQAASIGGALADVQTGLSSGQSINPINGVQSTILSQFKFMLSVIVFLSVDGHHALIRAVVLSYGTTLAPESIQLGLVGLLGTLFLVALQISLPALAVGMIVDSALGMVSRAVPTMQAIQIGVPVKLVMGLMAVSLGLPAVVGGTRFALDAAISAIQVALGIRMEF